MNFDMKKWIQDMIRADVKKPLPVLSFPGIQITGNTVEEIVGSGKLQADCMEAIAKKFDMAAVLSLMDLSVEAEAFGSPVRYSAEEVPTVTAPIIHDEDEAEALRRMRRIDKERTEYHRYFTGREWMDMENYDLPINASRIDYDQMIQLIKDYLKLKGFL